MTWDADVTAAVYAAAPWAVAATHTRGATVTACTVILEPESRMAPAEFRAGLVEGGIARARILISQVPAPARGDTMTVGTTVYTIDAVLSWDEAETVVAVRT